MSGGKRHNNPIVPKVKHQIEHSSVIVNWKKMTLLKSPSSPLLKYSAADPASQNVFLDVIKKWRSRNGVQCSVR